MVNIETIYIRIAECQACVNDENGNFDELAQQILADALQVKELQEDTVCLPHIQLDQSVWCDFYDCHIDAVFVGEDDAIRILTSSQDGANIDQYRPVQIPRGAILGVLLQIEKQLKRVEEKYWWAVYYQYFKDEFRSWRKLCGKDLLYSLQMSLMSTKQITAHPFKLGKPINQNVLKQFCREWEYTINDIINEVNEGASLDGIRVCDHCGLPMSEGYYLGGEFACDDDCCLALYNGDEAQMKEDLSHAEENDGECYYTEWNSIFFDN